MEQWIPSATRRQALEQVARSRTFARSEQLRRLLVWLGERSIGGEEPPREYDIGVLVLKRPQTFDPQTDSLVRKEMSRLREKLRHYYDTEGRGDAVRVGCNAYQVQFEPTTLTTGPDQDTGRCCVLVLPFVASNLGDLGETAEELFEELLSQFASTPAIELIAQTTARQYSGRTGDVRSFARETGADYIIESTARRKDNAMAVTLWLVDGRTGRVRRPCRLEGQAIPQLAADAARWLLGQVRPE